jgi:hypothetical protein
MSGIKIKLGCDPEFFLKNKRGSYRSAHDLVPGNKREPHKLNKGAIQADGTAVEFNIDAAETPEEFATNIKTVLEEVRKIVPEEYKFQFKPSINYNSEYFKEVPEGAKELGCDPDFNAWKLGEQNPRPVPNDGHRTASGHIHIGWTSGADVSDPAHLEDCMLVTRRMDYLLRPISVAWETQDDVARRKLYGDWGTFRPKPYGVEYRVLGNTWLRYPNLWPWLFQMFEYGFRTLEQGYGEDAAVYKPTVIDVGKSQAMHPTEDHGKIMSNLLSPVIPPGQFDPKVKTHLSYVNGDLRSLTATFAKCGTPPLLSPDLFSEVIGD